MTGYRGRFTLLSGRIVVLESLKQWHGMPGCSRDYPREREMTRSFNDSSDEARRQHGHDPFLITPVQQRIQYEGRYPFGEPARLPAIGSIGHFYSHQPARDPGKDCSEGRCLYETVNTL